MDQEEEIALFNSGWNAAGDELDDIGQEAVGTYIEQELIADLSSTSDNSSHGDASNNLPLIAAGIGLGILALGSIAVISFYRDKEGTEKTIKKLAADFISSLVDTPYKKLPKIERCPDDQF